MLKYICKCGKSKELQKATLVVKEGEVRTKEAECSCGKEIVYIFAPTKLYRHYEI